MALTFGFYNSIEGDRKYDAIQFGRIFDGIITDGVYATYEKGMVVKASDNAGEVIIQPGRAWFNHTWNYNDADFVMKAPAPEVLLDRIDALVLDINEEQAVRENSFAWVTGTPSSNPVRPTLTNNTTHHQYPLCYVRRYAETTMIYTKDITSMVGTSECPFVTGVLEGMDIDAWINQWDNEFHTWENATKVSFEAWMLTQQTDYTAWFNAVRDQLGTDMTEFEAWFESIKGIIDEEAATHLQAEIDEIKTMLPSGSHITITTTDTELFSRNVLLRDDFGHEITSKFNTSGVAVFETVPYVGSLTISSTDGIRTATNVVNTPYFARYEFPLAFWSATVNIEGDEDLAGYTVTVYNSEETVVSSIVLNAEAKGVFNATYPDEFIFRITYGGETMEVSLDVREETTYTVTLFAGFDWRTWCTLGGVSTSGYSSLSDLFNDEKAVRRLMTIHASADYLIEEVTKKLTTIDDFIANDTAMKWIGLRDYVCDGLTAITGVEAKFLASQYWERYLKDHVPVMTSNTAPYGTVVESSHVGNDLGYQAFDGDESKGWTPTSNATNNYVGYMFTTPCCVGTWKIKIVFNLSGNTAIPNRTFKLQGYNGTSWIDIKTFTVSGSSSAVTKTVEESAEIRSAYNGLRLFCAGSLYVSGSWIFQIRELQFYGRALDVSVPAMTSNTAPYGEVSASSVRKSGQEAYHAFDGNDSSFWAATTGTNGWISYKFTSPISVRKVKIYTINDKSLNWQVRYSDNGSSWTNVKGATGTTSSADPQLSINLDDVGSHLYWSALCTNGSGTSNTPSISTLQFYGVDYSEREFASGSTMKYLYDHGVELETISKIKGNATTSALPTNRDDQLYFAPLAGTIGASNYSMAYARLDLVNYSLMRAVAGDRLTSVNSDAGSMDIWASMPSGTYSDSQYNARKITIPPLTNPNSDIALDISSFNESKYVVYETINTNGRESSIKEWWLE